MLFIVFSGFLDTSWWLIVHAKYVDDWMILSQLIGPNIVIIATQDWEKLIFYDFPSRFSGIRFFDPKKGRVSHVNNLHPEVGKWARIVS